MPFEVLPLTADDVDAYAEIDARAMKDWVIAQAMEIEAQKKQESRKTMISTWMKTALQTHNPDNVWMKVVETSSGEIIAAANWVMELQPVEQKSEDTKPKDDTPAPVEGQSDAQHTQKAQSVLVAMRARWQQLKEQYIGAQPFFNLRVLVTDPKHQRKGAGTMLVGWGCGKADEAGVIAALQASDAGWGLYVKHGFELIEQDEFDLRPYGVDGTDTRRFMIRQPKPHAS